MKTFLYTIILLLSFENVCAQTMNEKYMFFSNSTTSSEYIEFITDSTLTYKPYYSGIGCSFAKPRKRSSSRTYKEYNYVKKKDTITIFGFNDSNDIKYRITENNYFENAKTKEIYVLRKILDKHENVVITYNNNYYQLELNGVITKNKKKNKKITRLLKSKDTSKLTIKTYRAYEAFEKFGYKYVFGVIELTKK
ncbi:hypothetical protein [uncultured Dokdonia sp.]|uniref:hypothetical protein n=1 Tax=uncultured Dokdonia sp. TaxID=575653 RepID=UPI00260A972B|nr:hypothetical protein [uncultured Dokdonia sp.]